MQIEWTVVAIAAALWVAVGAWTVRLRGRLFAVGCYGMAEECVDGDGARQTF